MKREKTKHQLLKEQRTQINRIINIVDSINDANGLVRTSMLRKVKESSPNASKKQMEKNLDMLKSIKRSDLNKEIVGYKEAKDDGVKIVRGEKARILYREARRGQLEDERLKARTKKELHDFLSIDAKPYKEHNNGLYDENEYLHSKGIVETDAEKEVKKIKDEILTAFENYSDNLTANELASIRSELDITQYLGYDQLSKFKDGGDNIYFMLTGRHLPPSGIM